MTLVTFLLLLQLQPTSAPVCQQPAQEVCEITFLVNTQPSRVDNAAKACLDEAALVLSTQPDSLLVIVGYADSKEPHRDTVAAQRAVNAKAYLVQDARVDSSRIVVRTGTDSDKAAKTCFVPGGVAFNKDIPGTKQVDEKAIKPPAGHVPPKKAPLKKAPPSQ